MDRKDPRPILEPQEHVRPGPPPKLIALPELDDPIDERPAPAASALIKDLHPLRQIKATLMVRVGSVQLRVGDLLDARANQVLTLDQTIHEAVDLMLEGTIVARGQLVAVGDCFGVRLTELPVSLSLKEGVHP